MGDSLSGRRILSEAEIAVKAIEGIGGASKLTEAEAKRINTTMTEAIAKAKALGIEAPAAFVSMEKATRAVSAETSNASAKTQDWKTQLSSLAGAFGIAFSGAALVNFGKELLNMGDEIVRVADRTGLTTKEVQQLSYVAGQSGNSIDELVGAIGQMQNRLASGDDSAVGALKKLNINFKELMAASPAEQMGMIATEIAKIPDPAVRAQVAMDLFGRSGIAILPTLISDFKGLAAAAPVMADDTVKALDSAGDALGRFGLSIKVWAAESYNFLQQGFQKLIAAAYTGVANLLDLTAKMVNAIPGASTVLAKLGVDVKSLGADAQWFRDAAAGMAVQTNNVTESAKRLAPVLEESAKSAKELNKEGAALRQTMNWVYEQEIKAEEANIKFRDSVEEATSSLRRFVATTPIVVQELQRVGSAMDYVDLATDQFKETAIQAVGMTVKVGDGFKNMSGKLVDFGGVMQSIGGVAKKALGDLNGIFQSAFEGGGGIGGAVKSLATNLVAGFTNMIPVVGPVISQFSGAIVAGFSKLFGIGKSAAQKEAEAATKEIRKLQGEVTKMFGSLDDIRKMGGAAGEALVAAWGSQGKAGLEHFNTLLDTFKQTMEDVDHYVDTFKQSLDDFTASGNLASGQMLDLLQRAREAGGELGKVAAEFTKNQLTGASKGLNAYFGAYMTAQSSLKDNEQKLSDLRKDWATADEKQRLKMIDQIMEATHQIEVQGKLMSTLQIGSPGAAEGVAASIFAAFSGLRESGVSAVDAIRQLQPAIDGLSSQMDKAGIKGGAAFKQLIDMSGLLNDKVAGPVIEGMIGLGDALVGLHNSGMLTQEMFGGLTEQIGVTFDRLTKQGYDGSAALQLMQPSLQKIWELQQDFGYAVDDSTQRMLDQGQAAGLVGQKHRSAQDLMAKGIDRLVELMELYLTHMGIDLPKATRVAQGEMEKWGDDARIQFETAQKAAETFNETATRPLTQTRTVITREVYEFMAGNFLPTSKDNPRGEGESDDRNMSHIFDGKSEGDAKNIWLAQNPDESSHDWDEKKNQYGFALGGLVPTYAAMGELVKFRPRGTDTVPAMLTPGERVLSVPQTKALDGLLNRAANNQGVEQRLDTLSDKFDKWIAQQAGRDRDEPFKTALLVKSALAKAS